LNFSIGLPYVKKCLWQRPGLLTRLQDRYFFKGSSFSDRADLIKAHIVAMEQVFNDEFIEKIYINKEAIVIWQDEFQEKPISMDIKFFNGQQKEGCLSVNLMYEGQWPLYQIIFSCFPSKEDGESALYIGALQGSNKGNDFVKALTKAYFGYRTKNLIFYGLRNVASMLGVKHLYAVSNAGHYAQNHMRMDRKVKTDLDGFWEECGGNKLSDKRFFEVPINEHIKEFSEMKPSKRANYRRRLAKMDEMRLAICENLKKYMK
jgi:Uncharacterized protein conserved in bacteria